MSSWLSQLCLLVYALATTTPCQALLPQSPQSFSFHQLGNNSCPTNNKKPLHHRDANTRQRPTYPASSSSSLGMLNGAASSDTVINAAVTAASTLNMDRVKIRLDGLGAYGVIASLLMNAALRLYSATPKKLAGDSAPTTWGKILFLLSVLTCVVTGSYTTVVFSLLGLYSKRALGVGHDTEFIQFFDATASYRGTAFSTFVASLITFQMSFVLSIFLNYDDGKLRWPAFLFALFLSLGCMWQWKSLMAVAGEILFHTGH